MTRIFVSLIKLNGIQLLKKPKILLFAFMMPALLIVGIHLTLTETIDEVRIPIIVVDEDQSDTSGEIFRAFAELDHFVQMTEVSSLHVGNQQLLRGEADAIIYVEEGFEERVFSGENNDLVSLIHTSSSLSRGLLREMVASEVMRYVSNSSASHYVLQYASEFSPKSLINEEELLEEVRTYSNEQWSPSPPLDLHVIGDNTNFREWEEEREFVTTEDLVMIGVITLILLFPLTFTVSFIHNRNKEAFRRISLYNVGSLFFGLAHWFVAVIVIMFMCIPLLLLTYQLYPESMNGGFLLALIAFIIISTLLSSIIGYLFQREQVFLFTVLLFTIGTVITSILLTEELIGTFYYSFISPQFVISNIELFSLSHLLAIFLGWLFITMLFCIYIYWRERDSIARSM